MAVNATNTRKRFKSLNYNIVYRNWLGPAIKDSLFEVPQGAHHFGLSKMT